MFEERKIWQPQYCGEKQSPIDFL